MDKPRFPERPSIQDSRPISKARTKKQAEGDKFTHVPSSYAPAGGKAPKDRRRRVLDRDIFAPRVYSVTAWTARGTALSECSISATNLLWRVDLCTIRASACRAGVLTGVRT